MSMYSHILIFGCIVLCCLSLSAGTHHLSGNPAHAPMQATGDRIARASNATLNSIKYPISIESHEAYRDKLMSSETIYYETFDNATSTNDWACYSLSAKQLGWFWSSGSGNPPPALRHGDITVSGVVSNWIVTPAFALPNVNQIQFSCDFIYFVTVPRTYYYSGAFISTGSRHPADKQYVEIARVSGAPGFINSVTADLSQYRGSNTVYIGFLYVGTNSHRMYVDNVKVIANMTGVDNAWLVGPSPITLTSYQITPVITGMLYTAGETGGQTPASNFTAQVGYGPRDSTPGTAWVWFDMPYVGAVQSNDVFARTIPITMAGQLDLAVRFCRSSGPWTYADLDGSTNGFSSPQAIKVDAICPTPPGSLLYQQSLAPPAAWYFSSYVNPPMISNIIADDFTFSSNLFLRAVRWTGYYPTGRAGNETGFWLRIYNDNPTDYGHPGALMQEEFHWGYNCESSTDVLWYYQANLQAPFFAEKGSTYWFAVQSVCTSVWGVVNSPAPRQGMPLELSLGDGIWATNTFNVGMGFQLFGEILGTGIPFVDVTSTSASVSYDIISWSIAGTNNFNVVGGMWSSNATAGGVAIGFPRIGMAFATPAVGLQVGVNTIFVYGTNAYGTITSDNVMITRGLAGTGKPFIDATNANRTVSYNVASATIGGTNNANAIGGMRWRNLLTGMTGDSPASQSWSISSIGLAIGTNNITVDGTNIYSVHAGDTVQVVRVALQPPTSVAATDGTYTDRVIVTWGATTGATKYRVYRNTSDTSSTAIDVSGEITGSSFNDSTATPGITYYYWLKAGNGSDWSGFSITDTGYRALTAPAGVTASDGLYADRVAVTWSASSGATKYVVYRNTVNNSTGAADISGEISGAAFDDTTASSGQQYYYWVKSGNGVYWSAFGASDAGYRLMAPASVTATDGTYTDRVLVTWGASAYATKYRVYRNTSNASSGASDVSSEITGTSFNDTSATPGVTYYYWIKAGNASGWTDFSIMDIGYRAMTAPAGVTASDGLYADRVAVMWNASAGATKYKVYRNGVDSSADAVDISGEISGTAFDDTTASSGQQYYYWVKSGNGVYWSAFGTSDAGYRLMAPASVTATDGTYTDHVVVTWAASTGATKYRVYRNTSDNSIGATDVSGELSVTSFNDTSASPGIPYYYWVKAGNASGWTDFSSMDTGYCGLTVPAGVTASDGVYPDRVAVTWNASSGATKYKVYRNSVDSSAGAADISGEITSTAFDDTSASPAQQYYYWVKSGSEATWSAFSTSDTGYKLSVPTAVSATDGTHSDKVRITWTAALGATRYMVYRNTANDSASATPISGDVTETFFDDTSGTHLQTYYYWVKAGSAIAWSDFSASAIGYRQVAAPTGVSASDGTYSDKVRITWNNMYGATKYMVYRSDSASTNAAVNISGELAGNTCEDTVVTLGQVYYYWVRSGWSGGWSDYSVSDTGYAGAQPTNRVPATPTNGQPINHATIQSLTPELAASAFSDPDGDTQTGSQWQVSMAVGFNSLSWDSGDNLAQTSISVAAGALAHETRYYWRVRYKDARGAWSAYSDSTWFETGKSNQLGRWNLDLLDMGSTERAQIVADGKGGCALLYDSTNGWKVLWVDKKQRTIYVKYFDMFQAIAIRSCDGKQLTYMHGSDPSSTVVIDNKGRELGALQTLGGWVDTEGANKARVQWQVPRDKKGVFAIVNVANTEEGEDPVYKLTYSTFK